jgi:hypothetical protein
MWAALEHDTTLSVAELARTTYGSFATAWRVRRDFGLLAKLPSSAGAAKSRDVISENQSKFTQGVRKKYKINA